MVAAVASVAVATADTCANVTHTVVVPSIVAQCVYMCVCQSARAHALVCARMCGHTSVCVCVYIVLCLRVHGVVCLSAVCCTTGVVWLLLLLLWSLLQWSWLSVVLALVLISVFVDELPAKLSKCPHLADLYKQGHNRTLLFVDDSIRSLSGICLTDRMPLSISRLSSADFPVSVTLARRILDYVEDLLRLDKADRKIGWKDAMGTADLPRAQRHKRLA